MDEETWIVVTQKERKRRRIEYQEETMSKSTTNKPTRPPLLTVDGLDPKQLVNLLKQTFKEDTNAVTSGVNVIQSNKSRIMLKSMGHYNELHQTLKEKNVGFFRHPIRGTLNKRATLRGLPHGYTEEEIKGMLPSNVISVKQFSDKHGKEIPVYGVTFPPQTTKEEINALQIIQCYRVNWTHSKHKKQGAGPPSKIKQCHNCQGFNHMARYCHKVTKCKICSQPHNTDECFSETPHSLTLFYLCDSLGSPRLITIPLP